MVKQTLGNFSCGALIWAGPLNSLTVVLIKIASMLRKDNDDVTHMNTDSRLKKL